MHALQLKLPPPLLCLACLALMFFAAASGPRLNLWLEWRSAFSLLLTLAGLALAYAGRQSFRRAKTTANPMRPEQSSALVMDGVYRYTRNPMYLGLLLVLLGFAVYLAALYSLSGPLVFVLYLSYFQIKPEEQILQQKFGDAYRDYCQRVRRWL